MRRTLLTLILLGPFALADPITPGPDTTVLEGPVRADGTIDYPAAINAQGAAIEPADNAAVILAAVMVTGHCGTLGDDPAYRDAVRGHLGWPDADPGIPLVRVDLLEGVDWGELGWDDPNATAWIHANRAAFDAMRDAPAQRPHMHWPVTPGNGGVARRLVGAEPYLVAARFWYRALSARAQLAMDAGDWDAAWADLYGLVGWSVRLVPQIAPTLIDHWAAFGLNTPHGAFLRLLNEAPEPTLAQMQRDMLHRDRLEPINAGLSGDRLGALDQWQLMVTGRALASVLSEDADLSARNLTLAEGFDPNVGLRLINDTFDQLATACDAPTAAERIEAVHAITRRLEQLEARLAESGLEVVPLLADPDRPIPPDASQTLAEVHLVTKTRGIARFIEARERNDALRALWPAAIAQQRHRLRHGDYASDWQTLIEAGLLNAAPLDHFTGGEALIRIDADGCTIYSVGQDLDDDAGRDFFDGYNPTDDDRGDLVIRMHS